MTTNGPPFNPNGTQCQAIVASTGEQCKKMAIAGGTVCRSHGGGAPQVKAAAARNVVKESLFAELTGHQKILGSPIYSDPVTILYDLIALSAGHVAWYKMMVEKLIPDALVWSESQVSQGAGGKLSVTQTATVNQWLQLYNAERKFLAELSTKAIAAGLAEREIRMEEERGKMLAETLREILADLELSPDQSERALQIVPLRLRAIVEGPHI
jgi:hypothetical protein